MSKYTKPVMEFVIYGADNQVVADMKDVRKLEENFIKAIDVLIKLERILYHQTTLAIDIRSDVMDLTGLSYVEALEIYQKRQKGLE